MLPKATNRTNKTRILGIDSSSQKIAWTLVVSGKPKSWGKIDLSKEKDMSKKLRIIILELTKVLEAEKPQAVYIEKPIFVRNHQTAITLSYIVSACLTTILFKQLDIYEVEPLPWKYWLGYTALNAKFVASCKRKMGSLQAKKFCDGLRKSQTYKVLQHNFNWSVLDHDITDSCGIALYGYNQLCKPLKLEISKNIALDQKELAKLGLTL